MTTVNESERNEGMRGACSKRGGIGNDDGEVIGQGKAAGSAWSRSLCCRHELRLEQWKNNCIHVAVALYFLQVKILEGSRVLFTSSCISVLMF